MPLLPDTARRHREPELMDSPSLPAESHRSALSGLARINAVSRSGSTIWSALRRRLGSPDRTIRVLDIACGGGDIARSLRRRARRAGVDLRVDGCDRSETAVGLARNCSGGAPALFFRLDAIAEPLPEGYDAMISNLFLHHLSTTNASILLGKMSTAAPVVVVTDLIRGSFGYATALIGTRVLSRSRVVHTDGPRSVRAAFTIDEVRRLAESAGLERARIRSVFPFRWRLDWGCA